MFKVLGNTNIKEDFEREETELDSDSKMYKTSNKKFKKSNSSKYKTTNKKSDINELSEYNQFNNNVSTRTFDEKLKNVKSVIIKEHDIYPSKNIKKKVKRTIRHSPEANTDSDEERLTPKLAGYKITSHSKFIENSNKPNKWDKYQQEIIKKSKNELSESHDNRLRTSLNEFRDANIRAEKQIEELEKLLDEQHHALLTDEYKDKSINKNVKNIDDIHKS